MRKSLFPHALPLSLLAPHWLAVAIALLLVAALNVGLTLLEQVSIVRMDAWIPLQSMEEAEWYSLVISTSAQAIRIALIGLAIVVAIRPLARNASTSLPVLKFLGFWAAISVLLGVVTLALDSVGYWLQFSGLTMDGPTFRWAFLGLIYAKLVAHFALLLWLFGAGAFATAFDRGLRAAWQATGWRDRVLAFLGFLVIWLSIDGVLVPLVSYLPMVSPFWFVPGEDEPSRYVVGQGTRIVAEALAFVLYALLWIRLFGRTLLPATAPANMP